MTLSDRVHLHSEFHLHNHFLLVQILGEPVVLTSGIINLKSDTFQKNQVMQNLASTLLLYITIIIVIVVIVIYLTSHKGSKTRSLTNARLFLEQGRFQDAASLYLENKRYNEAAETVLESPPGTQIMVYRLLQGSMEPGRLKSVFLAIGDKKIAENSFKMAALSYNYAGLPWKAAQTYILQGMGYVSDAVRIIEENPVLIKDRERSIRNLAKFAFDNRRVLEAAELLKLIGANDEATAILVASGKSPVQVQTTPPEAIATSLRSQISQVMEYLRKGKVADAEESLRRLQPLANTARAQSSLENQPILRDFSRVQNSVDSLKKARDAFKKNLSQDAQVSYSELIEHASDLLPAEVFAEAGLVYESSDPETAKEYYDMAADKAATPQAKNSYRQRAQAMALRTTASRTTLDGRPNIGTPVSVPQTVTTPPTNCSICKRLITAGETTAQCDSCGSVGHYGHLAEWVKIKGTCPVCRRRLVLPERKVEEQAL